MGEAYSDAEVAGVEAVLRAAMIDDHGGRSIGVVGNDPEHLRRLVEAIEALAPGWFAGVHSPAKQRIDFASGAQAHLLLARRPDVVRGMQFGFVWWAAEWVEPRHLLRRTWENLELGLRLGSRKMLETSVHQSRTWTCGQEAACG